MKYIGFLLIAWGALDLGLNLLMSIDLWGEIGITLPEVIWKYSAYIAFIAGYALIQFSKKDEPEEAAEQSS